MGEDVKRQMCEAIIATQDGSSGRMVCDMEKLLAHFNTHRQGAPAAPRDSAIESKLADASSSKELCERLAKPYVSNATIAEAIAALGELEKALKDNSKLKRLYESATLRAELMSAQQGTDTVRPVVAKNQARNALPVANASPAADALMRAETAEQRAAGLEVDALRYRWLRDRPSLIGWDWWITKVPADVLITEEFMDAAIDAAIREAAK